MELADKKTKNNGLSKRNGAMLLIILAWLVYSFSYLGKVNYSANITQIIDFYGVSKSQAGTVPTFFFFAYGIGQVFNGIFCKKYNIKWMVFLSLTVSAVINFIVAVSTDFAAIKWLWMINGFVLSILWPTLIRLLSETLPQKILGTSSVIMGTTVAIGTLIIYGLSSVYAFFDRFKLSFYTAAFAVIIVAIIWLLLYNKAVDFAKSEDDGVQAKEKSDATPEVTQKSIQNRLLFIVIGILCFYAVGVNLIKDGLTTWVPSILKDEFSMSDSLSILLTLLLPILAVFGNAFALKMHKKMPDYVNHCAVDFAIIAVLIGGIIASILSEIAVAMLVGLVVVNFLASSLNSLLTSVFPLFMRGKINSGLFAGIINGFCYLGSTISAYGLGVIADNFGWTAVFWTLIGFCLIVVAVWIVYSLIKKFSQNKNV